VPALEKEIQLAKIRFGLPLGAPVRSGYEAGRDGAPGELDQRTPVSIHGLRPAEPGPAGDPDQPLREHIRIT
jgi:hypothetical protein